MYTNSRIPKNLLILFLNALISKSQFLYINKGTTNNETNRESKIAELKYSFSYKTIENNIVLKTNNNVVLIDKTNISTIILNLLFIISPVYILTYESKCFSDKYHNYQKIVCYNK